MPSSLHARMMRTAISPRLAISSFSNGIAPKHSGHDHAAIDVQHLAGDVTGGIAAQEGDRLGDVVGGSFTASGNQLQHGVDGGLGYAAPDFGVDDPGGDGVASD